MMTTVGIPGMLVYVIVIPTIIALILIRQRHRLTLYPSQENYQSKWTLRFGFMFAGYREGYEWWESVVLLRKCLFVLLAIFLTPYGPAPQVVAASLILVFALSAELQNLPYQDNEHDKLETIGIQACLLQLQVALLCNLIRDQPIGSAETLSSVASLGPNATIILVIVMFGSTLYFFIRTIRAIIQGSQETAGVVGSLARCCGDRCGKRSAEEQRGAASLDGKSRNQTLLTLPRTVVAPKTTQQQQQPLPESSEATAHDNTEQEKEQEKEEEEYSRVQIAPEEAEQEVQRIRKRSEIARNKTMDKVREQEQKADARVQKRLELRKKAKQMGALQKCAAFSNISDICRDHIIDAMTYKKIARGTELCMQGHEADCMYLLMSGSCTVMVNMKEVGALSPLEIFGESALFASGDAQDPSRFRTATVIAVDDLEVLVLQEQELSRLVASGDLDESTIAALAQVAQERKGNRSKFCST